MECDERREEGLFWALREAVRASSASSPASSFKAVPAPDLTCSGSSGRWPRPPTCSSSGSVGTLRPRRARRQPVPECPCRSRAAPDRDVVRIEPRREGRTERFLDEWSSSQEKIRPPRRSSTCSTSGQSAISGSRAAPVPSRMERVWPAASRVPSSPSPNRSSSGESFLGSGSMRFSTTSRPDELSIRRASSTSLRGWRLHPTRSGRRPHSRTARAAAEHAVNIHNDASTERQNAAREWLTRSWELVHPWGSGGVFPNFADPELTDLATAYYGANRNRLVRIKAEYDADNLFRSPAHNGRGGRRSRADHSSRGPLAGSSRCAPHRARVAPTRTGRDVLPRARPVRTQAASREGRVPSPEHLPASRPQQESRRGLAPSRGEAATRCRSCRSIAGFAASDV